MPHIEEIAIENVKGIGKLVINERLYANKANILVAPNGFGKSSITCAFLSHKKTGISLQECDIHNSDSRNIPSLRVGINDDDQVIDAIATDNTSTFGANKIKVAIINSQLNSEATLKNAFPGGYPSAKSTLVIKPIVLLDSIPKNTKSSYSYSSAKREFGQNGKILPNITQFFSDSKLFCSCYQFLDDSGTAPKSKRLKTVLDDFIAQVNSIVGTSEEILSEIENKLLTNLKALDLISGLATTIQTHFANDSDATLYLKAIQFLKGYLGAKVNYESVFKYLSYKLLKEEINELLNSFNTSKSQIQAKTSAGKLIVEFPEAARLSNGERDVLCFVTMLVQQRRKLTSKYNVLIIDEVFDYLDEANLVAAQYYISSFIDEFKKEGRYIFPLIMTHIDPSYMKSFAFSEMKVFFLDKSISRENKSLVSIILEREKDNSTIKQVLDEYFFHFHPESRDLTNEFRSLGLDANYAKSGEFRSKMQKKMQSYLQGGTEYDPLAICCALRVKIEEVVYSAFAKQGDKDEFICKHKTRTKLEFACETGVNIPEVFFLLGIIYNEGLHLKGKNNVVISIGNKLKNMVIKKMIADVMRISSL